MNLRYNKIYEQHNGQEHRSGRSSNIRDTRTVIELVVRILFIPIMHISSLLCFFPSKIFETLKNISLYYVLKKNNS